MSRRASNGIADIAAEVQSMAHSVLVVLGDVADANDVTRAVSGVSAPMKDIVQILMILRYQMFEGMNIEDWNAFVVTPKFART